MEIQRKRLDLDAEKQAKMFELEAEKQAKIAVIFMAKDEEEVIGKTISSFLEGQDYPKELYDLYVVADNCSDNRPSVP